MNLFRRKKKVHISEVVQKALTYFVGNSPVIFYNFDQEDYIKQGYAANAEVYSIIKKITDKCNVAEPFIYIDKEGVKSKSLATSKNNRGNPLGLAKHKLAVKAVLDYADNDNDLSKLIKVPNETETWRELLTLLRVFYFVQGEGFLYRESGDDDCALSIHTAPPHMMQPFIRDNKLVGWQLNKGDGTTRNFLNKDANDVFHIKMPNPVFEGGRNIRGMSPLLAGLKYLKLSDESLHSWLKSVVNEGAKGIVSPNHSTPDMWLNPEQVKLVTETIEQKLHGSDNKNKVAVSGMPVTYHPIGLSPDALNVINALEKSEHKLCDLWNVPPVLFDPNPTYQNQSTAAKRFVSDTIVPYLNIEEDKLNKWLVQPFIERDNVQYVLDYDLSEMEELRLSIDQTDALLKTHSINEVRVMLGSDELEEEYANQVFIQQGTVPLSDFEIGTSFDN